MLTNIIAQTVRHRVIVNTMDIVTDVSMVTFSVMMVCVENLRVPDQTVVMIVCIFQTDRAIKTFLDLVIQAINLRTSNALRTAAMPQRPTETVVQLVSIPNQRERMTMHVAAATMVTT